MTTPIPAAQKADLWSIVVTTVKSCARCGKDHPDLMFRGFTKPCGEMTHYGFCPTNNEPILLKQIKPPCPANS